MQAVSLEKALEGLEIRPYKELASRLAAARSGDLLTELNLMLERVHRELVSSYSGQ